MRRISLIATLSLGLACRSEPGAVKQGDTSHDYDGDGFSEEDGDCDDNDAAVNPEAVESCDSIDNNCDGTVDESGDLTFYIDSDGDGYGDASETVQACSAPAGYIDNADDCDDQSADISPAADELCDGLDNDCDGTADNDASDAPIWYQDSDGDGYGVDDNSQTACEAPDGYVAEAGDCNADAADVYPGAPEVANDGIDQDCDGVDTQASTLADLAEGGLLISEVMHNPVAVEDYVGEWFEIYNPNDFAVDIQGLAFGSQVDDLMQVEESIIVQAASYVVFAVRSSANDNGGVENVAVQYDRDKLRLDNAGTIILQRADGQLLDQMSYNINQGYPTADGRSISLGILDHQSNDDSSSWCESTSSYGQGDLGTPGAANDECDLDGDGFPLSAGDCDDSNPDIHPFAQEICDGLDNDCDSLIDDADDSVLVSTNWYPDADGDGYGDPDLGEQACEAPSGYVANPDDCDDTDPAATPATTWYLDYDGDGYGGTAFEQQSCTQPSGYVANADDCDDLDAALNPATAWYLDVDGDGFGDPQSETLGCTGPSGSISDFSDCDDNNPAINPAATEICDTLDNDCDSLIDDDDSSVDLSAGGITYYVDSDGDGYGDAASTTVESCASSLSGYAANADDCDDANVAIHPAADEICDSIDNDCDTLVDDADDVIVGGTTYYADLDGDGYGDPDNALDACEIPENYLSDTQDCDDSNDMVKPGEREACDDGIDNNCDGDLSSNYCDFDLGNLAANGFTLDGASSVAQPIFGYTLTHAGDVNNDGEMDFAVGARLADEGGGSNSGATYVYYGPINQNLPTTQADAVLYGGADEKSSHALSGGSMLKGGINGDINNDGSDDLLISAIDNDLGGSNAGAVYVAYGNLSGVVDLTSTATAVYGENAGDQLGRGAVAILGDVNNDGFSDALVGAYKHGSGTTDDGAAYLLLGPITAGAVNSVASVSLYGGVDDGLGFAVGGPGDVNGDGFQDALIGAYRADGTDPTTGSALANNGKIYLFHGTSGGAPTWDITAPDASFEGVSSNDKTGYVVSGAGDVDNDGLQDVLIGAPHADVDGDLDGGAAYLMTGDPTGNIHLSNATAIFLREEGFGATDSTQFGRSVAAAGDIDGDGYDDILIGAKKSNRNGTDSGAVYVYFGPLSGTYRAPHAAISGAVAGDEAGIAVTGISDVSGGGRADLLIGAYKHNNVEGEAYLFLGESF